MIKRLKEIKQNKKGSSLIEMIVSFALIGIFLAATFTAISSAIIAYYHEREIMTAYTVADTVLSAIADDIHTMRPQRAMSNDGKIEALGGYVKIRDGASDTYVGNTVTSASEDADDDGNADYYGDTIEFLRASRDDVSFAQTINSKGFKGKLYKKSELISVDDDGNKGTVTREPGYLTMRYYSIDAKASDDTYKDLGADHLLTESGLDTSGPISRGLTEKLGADFYSGLYTDIHFFIPESAMVTDKMSVDEKAKIVRYVGATVDVYRDFDGTTYSNPLYSKTEYIDIENEVWFSDYKTLYSDLSSGVSFGEKPSKKDMTKTQTLGGKINWNDDGNKSGKRPASVVVKLTCSDGTTMSTEVKGDDWTYSFTEVPYYDSEGNVVTGSVTAEKIDFYDSYVSGMNITYTLNNEAEITFKLKAGDGVSEDESFNFEIESDDAGTVATEMKAFEVGKATSLIYNKDTKLTFKLDESYGDVYTVTFDNNPYTVADGGEVSATISKKKATLNVVTVAGNDFAKDTSPDITVTATLNGYKSQTESVNLAGLKGLKGLNSENTVITLTDYINAEYTVDVSGNDIGLYDIDISSSSGKLTEETTKVIVKLTRKTGSLSVNVAAGNEFALNKEFSILVTVKVKGDTSPSVSPFTVKVEDINETVNLFENNIQPTGAEYTVSVKDDFMDDYKIEINGNEVKKKAELTVSDNIIEGANNVHITMTRKVGYISITVSNNTASDSVSLNDIAVKPEGKIVVKVKRDEYTGDKEYFAYFYNDYTNKILALPIGTYEVTQTLPTLTGYSVTTSYELDGKNTGEDMLKNIEITEDDKESDPVTLVFKNVYKKE